MMDKYAAIEYLNLKFYLRQITKKIAAFPPFDQQGTLVGKLAAIELLTDIGNQNKQGVKINSMKAFLRRIKNYILRKCNKR